MSDDIQFVEVDSKAIENELIAKYEETTGETLYPGDEKRIFLLNMLSLIVGIRNDINDTGKQNLLRYARGTILDALGEFVRTPRLQPQKARTTLRYVLSDVQLEPIIIPSGRRVSLDGKIYFLTETELTIPAGELTGDVVGVASETGEKYNDFTPGQIKIIVDPVPFVASVSNIDTSSGGSDLENDDDYIERIRLAPESFSVAGSEGAYQYWTRTADSNIVDVAIEAPMEPIFNRTAFELAHPEIDLNPYFTEQRPTGIVKVVPLMANGEIPSQLILNKVNDTLSPKNRRPLTDYVQVEAPTVVEYNIDLTYYIDIERQTEESSIRAAIENEGGAVDQYIDWQQSELEREINPDELRKRLLVAGAYRIVLNNPVYTVINPTEVAKVNLKTVTYGGLI